MAERTIALIEHIKECRAHWVAERRGAPPIIETFYDGRIAQLDDMATWMAEHLKRIEGQI